MKIAQVAPLFESVPPKGYGGTERVVSYLTEELMEQGHEVTLFASGDSVTQAKLVPVIEESLRLDHQKLDWLAYYTLLLDTVFSSFRSFDVIHFHIDYLHLPLAKRSKMAYVTTLHGRLDLPELVPLYSRFAGAPLVSISDSQRSPLPWANWQGTVHHGLPLDLYSFYPDAGDYFAFVGRISPEKRVDRAIEIALRCGMPLYIAAKIDKNEETYFEEAIKPLLNHPLVEYVGEIGEVEKNEFLGKAKALLFPVEWPEPFGLVQIESFACGTPVIAYACGAVPEIMEDGITGFIVNNQQEAFEAALNVETINRRGCRDVFESRFTATHMAEQYVQVYRNLISRDQCSKITEETARG